MRFRFSIRDLFWLTLAVALVAASWLEWLEHSRLTRENRTLLNEAVAEKQAAEAWMIQAQTFQNRAVSFEQNRDYLYQRLQEARAEANR